VYPHLLASIFMRDSSLVSTTDLIGNTTLLITGESKEAADYEREESLDNNSLGASSEDYSEGDDEGDDGYKQGGYHPVSLGDRFNGARYTVVQKLGWGHFSTVWMSHDNKAQVNGTPEYIALKVQKSAQHYREAAYDEIELLKCVSTAAQSERVRQEFGPGYDPCVVILHDHFEHSGVNGRHVCMTFEMLGENLLKVIKKYDYRGIPLYIVKQFTYQICVGLDFLHRHCSIIHTDLKPENILIAQGPPVPDMSVVKALISGGGGGGKKGGKKGPGNATSKSSAGPSSGDMRADIESMEKQLMDSNAKGLSTEQRKKLKKKLKKKRQQARKKDETKKRGGGGGRRGGGTAGVSSGGKLRAELDRDEDEIDNVVEEMLLMEIDSIPQAELLRLQSVPGSGHHDGEEGEVDYRGNDRGGYSSATAVDITDSIAEPRGPTNRAVGASEGKGYKDEPLSDAKQRIDDNEEEAEEDENYDSDDGRGGGDYGIYEDLDDRAAGKKGHASTAASVTFGGSLTSIGRGGPAVPTTELAFGAHSDSTQPNSPDWPHWLRPTLFSFLNFVTDASKGYDGAAEEGKGPNSLSASPIKGGSDRSTSRNPTRLLFDDSISIHPRAWISPHESMSAKISMVSRRNLHRFSCPTVYSPL
jgi:Protein kinase domain